MGTDSHASDVGHWLGMTPLRGVRGDAPQGYLLRCVGIAPYGRVTRVRRVNVSPTVTRLTYCSPYLGNKAAASWR